VKITVGFAGPCDAPQPVVGRVKPRNPKTKVKLQRRVGSEFETVDTDRLDKRSSYELLAPTCAGQFRVAWPSQRRKNASGAKRFRF
jgi:hypothetical protein